MRVVTWNLNRRRGALPSQVAWLATTGADVICLQEVTVGSSGLLRDRLLDVGFGSFVSTADECSSGPRRYGLAIASREPLKRVAPHTPPIWEERLLRVEGSLGTILTTHIPPGSSNGTIKVQVLEAVYDEMLSASQVPTVLAGDFNAPQLEIPELVTWAQRLRASGEWALSKSHGVNWDLAERRFFNGSITDAFRVLHPDAEASSWTMHRKGRSFSRRFDHLFCSLHWRPVSAEYAVENRSLSDHRALIVDLALIPNEAASV